MTALQCPYANHCSGCSTFGMPKVNQHQAHKDNLGSRWAEAELPQLPEQIAIHELPKEVGRDVAEFSFRRKATRSTVGLFHKNKSELIEITQCAVLSDELNVLLSWLNSNPPPIDRCSLRLRLSPKKELGAWIDAANIDILSLLNESTWLSKLMTVAIVEMGQKHKRLIRDADGLKLVKAVLHPWFQTYMSDGNPQPLWMTIPSFSQPSIKGNALLINRVIKAIHLSKIKTWLEFGAGSGNLSFPTSDISDSLIATESAPLARKGMGLAMSQNPKITGIEISRLNLQRHSLESQQCISNAAGLVLDPPRSGVGQMLFNLKKSMPLPKAILYLSCDLKGLIKDATVFHQLNYKLEHVEGIDQFPNTQKCEWLFLFSLNGG